MDSLLESPMAVNIHRKKLKPNCVKPSVNCSVMSDSFVIPWTVAPQSPLAMEFSRQEYWSWLSFPPVGDFPNRGIGFQVSCIADGFFTVWVMAPSFVCQPTLHWHEPTSHSLNIPNTHNSVPLYLQVSPWHEYLSLHHLVNFHSIFLWSNKNITFLNYTSLFKQLCYHSYHTLLELFLYRSISSARLHDVIRVNCRRT